MPYVRCANCFSRSRINRRPDEYASAGRVPRCRHCGSRHYWIDNYRLKRRLAQQTCTCRHGLYPFPHRRGSKWCGYNPNWTVEEAEQEFGRDEPFWWLDDPLCFGRRPVSSIDPPF